MTQVPPDFPMEATIELIQRCRNDDAIERAQGKVARQKVVRKIVEDVARHHGVEPKILATVTASMMEGKNFHWSWITDDWRDEATKEAEAPQPSAGM